MGTLGPGTGTEHHAGDATAMGMGRGQPLGAGGGRHRVALGFFVATLLGPQVMLKEVVHVVTED